MTEERIMRLKELANEILQIVTAATTESTPAAPEEAGISANSKFAAENPPDATGVQTSGDLL